MASFPIYALHKDADGAILNAGSFSYGFQLNEWLRGVDVRAGDRIEFGEVLARADTAIEPPAPLTVPDALAPESVAA